MEKIVFGDGEKIGVTDGESTRYLESEFIRRYRDYAENREKNNEWKFGGEGARFRGDFDANRSYTERIDAFVNGVQWDGEKIVYSCTVNSSSGVYRKELADEKAREDHIISFNEESITSLHRRGARYAVTVQRGIVSDIGILDGATSELKTLTGGDSRDSNASFSMHAPNELLFDSAGVGRDANGGFTGKYAPSVVCSLNLDTMEIRELLTDEKLSFCKPKQTADGTLYCIQRPTKEKKGGNLFLDILLFPFRIVQALVMFVQLFVVAFTGKSLTSQSNSTGANPTKGRDSDSNKIFIDGNRIEAEKELKRNKKRKERDYGFIPMSWKLVKIADGKREVIRSGVCDYDLTADGGVVCTNGRHIFYCKDGVTKKLADTEKCLCVAAAHEIKADGDLFAV